MGRIKDAVLYATDLHGEIHAYERLLSLAEKPNVKTIIIGGDITPFLSAIGDIAIYQHEFIKHYLIPRLAEFKKDVKKPVFIMMGNDDLKNNENLLKRAAKDGIFKYMNRRVFKLGSKYVAGYSHINEAPFLLKDWEKPENKILKDLERLAKLSDPGKTIYVIHAPPLGTTLDVIFSGEHVGSSAILEFIQRFQPYLTLHGHIHESYDVTGAYKERIGETLCVNQGKQRLLLFDPNDLKQMKVLNI